MPSDEASRSGAPVADGLVGRTLASDVLHRLRADIVASRFLPDERLRFEALRDRYRASFGTLREALAHLVEEGVVVAEGQRGFRVAPVSRADLTDLLDTRILLEREALRLSLLQGDATWRAAVTEAFDRLEAARCQVMAEGMAATPEWHRRHRAFHDSLVAACGSATLLDIRAMLVRRTERYRTLAWRLCPEDAGPVGDHRDLYEAAIAQDVRRLRVLVEGQIRRFGDRLVAQAGGLLAPD